MANLLHDQLPKDAAVYIEHSNEVWNFGFSQYTYNKLNAVDVCKTTDNKDPMCSIPCPDKHSPNSTTPCIDSEVLAQRRHLQRLHETVREFAVVFGEEEINKRIRGIYAEWTRFPDHYNQTLTWFEQAYGHGAASKYLLPWRRLPTSTTTTLGTASRLCLQMRRSRTL